MVDRRLRVACFATTLRRLTPDPEGSGVGLGAIADAQGTATDGRTPIRRR